MTTKIDSRARHEIIEQLDDDALFDQDFRTQQELEAEEAFRQQYEKDLQEEFARQDVLNGLDDNLVEKITDRDLYERRVHSLGYLSSYEEQLYQAYLAELDAIGATAKPDLSYVDYDDYGYYESWRDPDDPTELDHILFAPPIEADGIDTPGVEPAADSVYIDLDSPDLTVEDFA